MNKCKDCIHFEFCRPYTEPDESFPEAGGCKGFKNKADFVEVKCELQILTDTDGEPYMVIAKGNQAKYLVELMQKEEVGTATERSDT